VPPHKTKLTSSGETVELPKFKYHPDPIKTGAIKKSNEVCECCEQARGYVYTSSIYAEQEVEYICPWCIADGTAAQKFNGIFCDDYPLEEAGVSEKVISEVCERTPGYNSWQQEIWQVHCGTACEFHGDAQKKDLIALVGAELDRFLRVEMIKPEDWPHILDQYEMGGNPAIYKFICPECSAVIYTMDYL
jgi:Uncharacterized protein conserved in bacteria